MSVIWTLYSPLSPQEMVALETDCERAVEEYLAEHGEGDGCAAEVGGASPSLESVRRAYASLGLVLPEEVERRHRATRSSISIERPDFDDPLTVAVVRFLLTRAGTGLVVCNDYPLVTVEEEQARLAKKRAVRGFGAPEPTPKRKPVRRRLEKTGETRAVRVLETLQRAQSDTDLRLDVLRVLKGVTDLARSYAALLLEEGAMPDADAARALHVTTDAVGEAAEALVAALEQRG